MIWEVFIIANQNNESQGKYYNLNSFIANSFDISDEDEDFNFNENINQNEGANQLSLINPIHKTKESLLLSNTQHVKFLDIQFNNMYKQIFDSKCSNKDIKSMKRFIKRKLENDDLCRKSTVPYFHWKKALKSQHKTVSNENVNINSISTLIGQPRLIGTPENNTFQKHREYIKRPISAKRNKNFLKMNRILVNSKIEVCEQLKDKSSSYSDSENSFSSSDHEEDYEYYNESKLSMISNDKQVESESTPKANTSSKNVSSKNINGQKRQTVLKHSSKNLALLKQKSFMRKKTIIMGTTKLEDDESESEDLELDGDYIIKRALLKDHNIGDLSKKEMDYCLKI